MSENILDLTRTKKENELSEGYAERITLTSFSSSGKEIQLTLGGYPYRFIHLKKDDIKTIMDVLSEWLEE